MTRNRTIPETSTFIADYLNPYLRRQYGVSIEVAPIGLRDSLDAVLWDIFWTADHPEAGFEELSDLPDPSSNIEIDE